MQTRIQVVQMHDLQMEFDAIKLLWLTEDELTRYKSISSVQRKRQFLAGHYLARNMASRLFANTVEDWIYHVNDNNQRRLKCRQPDIPELYVSLSHSGDWVAAAISTAAIGIDIETYNKQRDFIAIASHVFSESETRLLKSLAPGNLNRQFYLYWTLKESVAKQFGDGLKFEVSRAHSFIPATEPAAASIISWQCPEYVLALSGKRGRDIEAFGLCETAEQMHWQNVSA